MLCTYIREPLFSTPKGNKTEKGCTGKKGLTEQLRKKWNLLDQRTLKPGKEGSIYFLYKYQLKIFKNQTILFYTQGHA